MVLQWARQKKDTDHEHVSNDEEVDHHSSNATESDDEMIRIEKDWMIEYVATKSIWTIDLVMLLQHIVSSANNGSESETNIKSSSGDNGGHDAQTQNSEGECLLLDNKQQHQRRTNLSLPSLSYVFCSTNFGVDESYNELGYYKHEFSSDEQRVKSLFEKAKEQSLPLLETSNLTLQVLVDVISHKGIVAIVLLDNRILKYHDVQHTTGSYAGHYVIVCGVSHDENDINYANMNLPAKEELEVSDSHESDRDKDFCLVVKNPGLWKQVEYVSPSLFDMAWKAKGTDQDVIFIHNGSND